MKAPPQLFFYYFRCYLPGVFHEHRHDVLRGMMKSCFLCRGLHGCLDAASAEDAAAVVNRIFSVPLRLKRLHGARLGAVRKCFRRAFTFYTSSVAFAARKVDRLSGNFIGK